MRPFIRNFTILLSSLIIGLAGFAQDAAVPQNQSLDFYFQLKKDDFMRTMIAKEKYLLGMVQNASEEIKLRKSEGLRSSDMGLDNLVSPDEALIAEYSDELETTFALLAEIERLEKLAKREVNLQALEALAQLKEDVRQIIEAEKSGTAVNILDDAGITETDLDSLRVMEPAQEEVKPLDAAAYSEMFDEWKYNRIIDYFVKVSEYEYIRIRLLKTATPKQEKRMFQRDLVRSIDSYMAGDFSLSRLQFLDLMETYTEYKLLDDVLYFASESSYGLNLLDEALTGYQRVVDEYPESPFAAKSLVKMIFIYSIYNELGKMQEAFAGLLPIFSLIEPEERSTAAYLLGYHTFRGGQYQEALNIIRNVPPSTRYFYPSLYLSAACYSNLDNDELSISIYQRLIDEKNKGDSDEVLAQIKNNALLKLGFIYYEQGEHQKAENYFELVSSDFQHYDLSLMGKAWNAYRLGLPGEALRSAQTVLQDAMLSSYAYEAMVLAASSKELMGYSEEAIEDLKLVYQVGSGGGSAAEGDVAEALSPDGMEALDPEILAEIMQIRRFLQSVNPETNEWEGRKNGDSRSLHTDQQRLSETIDALDQMERQARLSGNAPMLEEIRKLRSDLLVTLEDHSAPASPFSMDPDEAPLLRRMGFSEYMKYIFQSLLDQTVREKMQTGQNIKEAESLMEAATQSDEFELSLQMEVTREELFDYYGKLNQYEVWLRENFPQEFKVELDRWATFSGYGISDINFTRIQENEVKITEIARSVELLDHVFETKRKHLEVRIDGLLADVATIEKQMQRDAEKREQKERDRFFKTEYFDKRKQENYLGQLKNLEKNEKK